MRVRVSVGYIEDGVLYLGRRFFGENTYQKIKEVIDRHKITKIDAQDVILPKQTVDFVVKLISEGVEVRLSSKKSIEINNILNGGKLQIEENGEDYLNWVVDRSNKLGNPLMVMVKEDKQYVVRVINDIKDKGRRRLHIIRLRSFATQPRYCYEAVHKGKDIWINEFIDATEILNGNIVLRFAGTEHEYAILYVLDLVIKKEVGFKK